MTTALATTVEITYGQERVREQEDDMPFIWYRKG
jgi:hypothetical protein